MRILRITVPSGIELSIVLHQLGPNAKPIIINLTNILQLEDQGIHPACYILYTSAKSLTCSELFTMDLCVNKAAFGFPVVPDVNNILHPSKQDTASCSAPIASTSIPDASSSTSQYRRVPLRRSTNVRSIGRRVS